MLKHILSARDFDKDTLFKIFKLADDLDKTPRTVMSNVLHGKSFVLFFFTESTRTRFSFEKAVRELGGDVTIIQETRGLSIDKGESVEDTFITLATIGYEYFIIRHYMEFFPHNIAKILDDYGFNVHVINAGDGWNEHPTQAIGDLYTLYRVFGKIDDLRILFVGDLYHHRTLHSLLILFTLFKNIKLFFLSPKEIGVPDQYRKILSNNNISIVEFESNKIDIINDIVDKYDIDVIYILPIIVILRQKYKSMGLPDVFDMISNYTISYDILAKCKKRKIYIMHPFPRHGMIPEYIDRTEYALYFKQMYYGYLTKKALLTLLASEEEHVE